MLTMAIIALGTVAYFNIGHKWGRWSWKAWHRKRRSFGGLLCFPMSYNDNEIGETNKILIAGFDKDGYEKLIAVFWPFKFAFNFVALCSLVLEIVASKIFQLSISPLSLFSKKTVKELPAAEPEAKPFDIDERQHLLEQRDKINARLKELDSHPDKEVVLAQTRRF